MSDLKMPNTNLLVIDGRLTKDPRFGAAKERTWCQFGLAHDDWRNGKAETDFWEVACWGKTADIAGALRKGAPVIVEGRLGRDRWTDKDGKSHDAARIFASRVRALTWPDDQPAPGRPQDDEPIPQDDAPF